MSRSRDGAADRRRVTLIGSESASDPDSFDRSGEGDLALRLEWDDEVREIVLDGAERATGTALRNDDVDEPRDKTSVCGRSSKATTLDGSSPSDATGFGPVVTTTVATSGLTASIR